jgi:hypothetical protein
MRMPIPVAVRSKAEACECSILIIAGLILTVGMVVCPFCLLCVV